MMAGSINDAGAGTAATPAAVVVVADAGSTSNWNCSSADGSDRLLLCHPPLTAGRPSLLVYHDESPATAAAKSTAGIIDADAPDPVR
jgi:hypothetical protein